MRSRNLYEMQYLTGSQWKWTRVVMPGLGVSKNGVNVELLYAIWCSSVTFLSFVIYLSFASSYHRSDT